MLYPHLAGRLFNRPLLVLPEYAQVVTTVLSERLGVEPMVGAEVVQRYKRPNVQSFIDRSGIAVVPIVGGVVHRGDGVDAPSGIQSYTSIQNKLTALLDDGKVNGILLDIDSPGGEVAGLAELSQFITQMSGEKPVWAIANTLAASAACWIASSAARFYAAPNANVGSIGVYVQHTDMSKLLEKRGLDVTLIHAGKHKVDGNPYEPLSDEVRADIQASVDSLWGEFAGFVAERRGLTEEKVKSFEARVFNADQALENGLVDGIGTLGSVLTAFATHLNDRAYGGGQSYGEASMVDKALHTESDLAAARAAGHAEGLKAGTEQGAAKATSGFADALATLFPGSKRAEAFADLLRDGASVSMAAKHAAKIEDAAPQPAAEAQKSATAAHVDQFMHANTPVVENEGQDRLTDREKRLAEISGVTTGYAKARGYIGR